MKYQDSVFTMLARRSVLPWQGLGPLTARLDALDLVAVHDQLVLHTSSQNHLARNERGLAFSPILTSCLNLPCTVSYLNGIYSLSLRFIVIVIVSLDVVGGAPMLAGLQQASTVQHVKGLRMLEANVRLSLVASSGTQSTRRPWTYPQHPPHQAWFPRGPGRRWPARHAALIQAAMEQAPGRPSGQCGRNR